MKFEQKTRLVFHPVVSYRQRLSRIVLKNIIPHPAIERKAVIDSFPPVGGGSRQIISVRTVFSQRKNV
ncbi:MAG: hypothetical protein MR913_12455 [Clostridiales bacterium]|nr:hypothetical protein [Clostridiales bacterium]